MSLGFIDKYGCFFHLLIMNFSQIDDIFDILENTLEKVL